VDDSLKHDYPGLDTLIKGQIGKQVKVSFVSKDGSAYVLTANDAHNRQRGIN
jgi:hypothetical protein